MGTQRSIPVQKKWVTLPHKDPITFYQCIYNPKAPFRESGTELFWTPLTHLCFLHSKILRGRDEIHR